MIVDKAWITNYIETRPAPQVAQMVGRALVGLFERQTNEEQSANDTRLNNNIGFTGFDGRAGCLTAKYFMKHKTLEEWQVKRWTKPNKNGVPRIAKYWKQLDEIAQEKAKKSVDKAA